MYVEVIELNLNEDCAILTKSFPAYDLTQLCTYPKVLKIFINRLAHLHASELTGGDVPCGDVPPSRRSHGSVPVISSLPILLFGLGLLSCGERI